MTCEQCLLAWVCGKRDGSEYGCDRCAAITACSLSCVWRGSIGIGVVGMVCAQTHAVFLVPGPDQTWVGVFGGHVWPS